MNHACVANSHRAFIGDIMIVRAAKDIKKDDEILISYRLPDMDHAETQKALKNWDFTCTCRLCTAEAQTSPSDRKERQALIKQTSAFLERYEDPSQYTYDPEAFARSKIIFNQLENTYDASVFANVPRLPLIRLFSWISTAFDRNTIAFENSLQAAQRVLKECCYIINIEDQSMKIDDTHCFSDGTDVSAAICAARACFRLGKVELGQQYAAFARERDVILHGATKISGGASMAN